MVKEIDYKVWADTFKLDHSENMKISAKGNLSGNCPQQKWRGSSPETMQTAFFSGQNMMLIQQSDDKKTEYELHYLGFQSVGFEGLELAKSEAPEFARTVLKEMIELISNDEPKL